MSGPARYQRAAATLLVAAVLAAVIAPTAAAQEASASATPPGGCATALRIARHVLAGLGGDAATWSSIHSGDYYGMTIPVGTNGSRVMVSDEAPCRMVPSIVRHEWMHQQQLRWFGPLALERRDDVEIMADCGSWILGSQYTPYIDRARREGSAGCTTAEFDYARAMITAAGVPIVWRQP